MSTSIPEILNPLDHAGTNKFERLSKELDFTYVQVEERHEADFLVYAEKLARSIQYYDDANLPSGNWQSFYDVNLPEDRPHRALFIAFVRLLEALNEHANGLSKRYLDYYYKEVLHFVKREGKPESVHLFMECADTLKERFVAASAQLIAGKNADGDDILFELVEEIIVNRIRVDRVMSVYKHNEDFDDRLFSKDYSNFLTQSTDENKDGFPVFGEHQLVFNKQAALGFQYELKPTDLQTMERAMVGIAIASPVLRLEEGVRFIQVRLLLERDNNEAFNLDEFSFDISTEKGWTNWDDMSGNVTLISTSQSEVILEFKLEETDHAIVNYNTEVHAGNYTTNSPILRMTLSHDHISFGYKIWKSVKLKNVGLKASATGVRSLIVQNELSAQDPSKPFRPFGPLPSVGSHFYIGHNDIFRNKLIAANITISWKDVPKSLLGDHYLDYQETITNSSFKVVTSLLEDRVWKNGFGPMNLFEVDAKTPVSLPLDFGSYKRKTDNVTSTEWNYDVHHGYARVTLVGPDLPKFQAFGHTVYPKDVIFNSNLGKTIEQPYTPMIEQLTLDFETEEIFVADYEVDDIYHIEPFGQRKLDFSSPLYQDDFLPQFTQEGTFYIGLKDVVTPQSINLLFQLSEGTGNAAKSQIQTGVEWSYLSGNEWMPINRLRISKDTTRNLLNTGIIRFDLSKEMDEVHSIMPGGLFWLRASMPDSTAGIDRIQNVHAQAIESKEVAPATNDKVIEPDTIGKLIDGNKGIRAINQPYASFGGTSKDTEEIFYARSTERLRHKDRGVMIWDYERLVLDEFPDLYKVKCLNHTNYQTEMVAGHVMIAVVPDLRNKGIHLPFQPKWSMHRRAEVYEFLRERISPFIYLRVENPIYEPIQLSFNVGFHLGYDEGFYGKKLHQQLQEFLSPWAFKSQLNENSDLVFGGELHKSVILKFIEDIEYVDFVNDFNMHHIYQDDRVEARFNTELNSTTAYFYSTSTPDGACDVIKMAIDVEDENKLTSLIEVKIRFLKGLIEDTTYPDLTSRFRSELYELINSHSRKGKKLTKTALRLLIKNIYYVDKIVDLALYKLLPDDYVMEDVDVAIAKTSRSIMVTAEQHQIGVYRSGDYQCEGNLVIGIGFMIVEADFIIPSLNERNYEYEAR